MIPAHETFDGTWPFAPRFFEENGFRMHYVEEVDGEPIVCLHGEPTIGGQVIPSYNGSDPDAAAKAKEFNAALAATLKQSGLVAGPANRAEINMFIVLLVVIALLTFGILTFAPTASMLIELFPSRIRYTALSVPYHLGVAWFGGFLPAIAFTIVAATGDIYSGLYYPAIIAAISSVVVLVFAKETSGVDIYTP